MKALQVAQWVATFAVGSALLIIEAVRPGGPNWALLGLAGVLLASPALSKGIRIDVTPLGGPREPRTPE